MKRTLLLVIASSLLGLLVTACGGGGGGSLSTGDVAVVGGQKITKDDFDALLERAKKSYASQKRKFPKPGTQEYETLKSQAVTFLVQRAEFAEKAGDMGIDISDKQIDDKIASLKKQFYGGSEKRYEAALKQQGLTPETARNEVKAQLISEGLYKKVTADVKVSNKAIEDYYKANKSVYVQKASRDIRHILVNKKSLADQIHSQLVAAHENNFAKLAKKYSKDPGSASNGGKLTITRGQTVPAFDKTAFTLKTGQLSPPVHTQYGWHIIQALSKIKPPSTTPLDKVKDSIRQQLEQQQKNDVMTKWVDKTKKDFCSDSHIKYQAGFRPNPDPCASVNTTTAATTTG
jgi:foldase protein PrsA